MLSLWCMTGALSPPTYNPPHCYLNSTDSAHCSSVVIRYPWPHNVVRFESSSCPTSKQSRRMFPSTTPQQLPRIVMQIHTYGGLRPAYPTRRLLLVRFPSVELNLTAVFTYSAHTGYNSRVTGPVLASTALQWIELVCKVEIHQIALARATSFKHFNIMRYGPDMRTLSPKLQRDEQLHPGDYICVVPGS